jgi:uncharacterized membrane protein
MTRARPVFLWVGIVLLVFIAFFAVGKRISIDLPSLTAGTLPPDPFDHRYVLHPAISYLHILPGIVYLLGAPFQLSRRFRTRHLAIHRRMGRVVWAAGLISGLFAILFGAVFAFGGFFEASATVVFALYFIAALVIAIRGIKARDVTRHRRWMIRAFAIGLAIGTIRIWLALFPALGIFAFEDSFGPAFWLSFTLHALVAEAYLAWRPLASGGRPVPAT